MTTFSIVNSNSNATGDPATTSLSSPAIGNIIIAHCIVRTATAHADHVVTWNGTDVPVKAVGLDNELGDSNARFSMSTWYMPITTADGSFISFDDGTSDPKGIIAFQLTPSEAYDYTLQAAVAAGSGTGSTSPQSSGNTANITGGGDILLQISGAAWRNQTGGPGDIAFANTADVVSVVGGNNARSLALAFADEVADGVHSDEVSWTGSGHEGGCATLIFSDGALAGGAITLDADLTLPGLELAAGLSNPVNLAAALTLPGLELAASINRLSARDLSGAVSNPLGRYGTVSNPSARSGAVSGPAGRTGGVSNPAGRMATVENPA